MWRDETFGRAMFVRLAAGLVAPVAIWAALPWTQAIWEVAAIRTALARNASRHLAGPLPASTEDPQAILRQLAVDPEIRASTAVYEAALLKRQEVGPSGILPVLWATGTSHDRVLRAVEMVDRLFSVERSQLRVAPRRLGLQATIGSAAAIAGVDGAFLLRTADLESGFNPYARADSTTARGLFQFVEQTWLTSVAKWGSRHGLGHEARLIRIDGRGRAFVSDPSAERAILALRYDPDLAARMAAELAADNASILRAGLGRAPNAQELYAAHLLGPSGAVRLIQAAYQRPAYPAAWLFPAAAKKNPHLFYRAGALRSVSELLLGLS